MRLRLFPILLDAAGAEGNGNAAEAKATPAPAADPVKAALENANAVELARTLQSRLDAMTAERDGLRAQVPAAGSVVLSPEDAPAWSAYQALGAADDIKARLDAGDAATRKAASLERADTLRRAAAAEGWDADVLATLAGEGLDVRLAEVEKAGKKVPVGRVHTADAEGKEKVEPIADYFKRTLHPNLLGSLKAAGPAIGTPRVAPARAVEGREAAAGGAAGRPKPLAKF